MRALLIIAVLTTPALARHDAASPVTDYSAYTLNDNEWRVGVFRLEYGLFDSVQLGTLTLPWALKIANAAVKYRPWQSGRYSVSAELGFFALDLADFVPEEDRDPDTEYPKIQVVPFTVMGSSRHDDFTFSGGVSFTWFNLAGGTAVSESDLQGVGGASTILFRPTMEWRWSPTFALVTEGRIKILERYSGNVVTTNEIDEDTTLDVYGSGGAEVEGAKGNVSVSGFWSWDTFNLRLGIAYGHIAVPVANVFLPVVAPIPEVDLFWRF